MVVEQPAPAEKVLPAIPPELGPRVKAPRALLTAEPDCAGSLAGENPQTFGRTTFAVLPGCAARFGTDFRGYRGIVGRKVSGKFLGLSKTRASRQQHQKNCPMRTNPAG